MKLWKRLRLIGYVLVHKLEPWDTEKEGSSVNVWKQIALKQQNEINQLKKQIRRINESYIQYINQLKKERKE